MSLHVVSRLYGADMAAWTARQVAPREAFPSLERSRTLKRVDDQPVWSIVCFYVAKPYRRKGLMAELLRAAIDYARQCGAKIVEGYPIEPKHDEWQYRTAQFNTSLS